MATPVVSGVAALLASRGLTGRQIAATLLSTAADAGPAGYDTTYGAGIVRADRAVVASTGLAYTPPADSSLPVVSGVDVAAGASIRTTAKRVKWKLKRRTGWKRIRGAGMFTGSWTKVKKTSSKRIVQKFRIKRGYIWKRSVIYRKRVVTKNSVQQRRRVMVSATDDTAVTRVGLVVGGDWMATDWTTTDGFWFDVPCGSSAASLAVWAFDTNNRATQLKATRSLAC
jgi:hypothetical protein